MKWVAEEPKKFGITIWSQQVDSEEKVEGAYDQTIIHRELVFGCYWDNFKKFKVS